MITELPGGFCFLCDSAYKEMSEQHRASCNPNNDKPIKTDRRTSVAYRAWSRAQVSRDWSCKCEFPQFGFHRRQRPEYEYEGSDRRKIFSRCEACDRRIYCEWKKVSGYCEELVPIKKEGS